MKRHPHSVRTWTTIGTLIGWAGLLLWVFLTQVFILPHPLAPRRGALAYAPPASLAVGSDRAHAATVTTSVAFDQGKYVVDEGDGTVTVALHITPPAPHPVTATLSTATVNATAPEDYVALRQLNVIPAGQTVVTVTVQIVDDSIVEGEEHFLITLSNLEGAQAGAITETEVLIQDNDVAYLSLAPVVVDERAGQVVLTVSQSVTSTLISVVDYQTADGTAHAGQDYQAAFGTVTIPPGSTQTTITITLIDDAIVEPDETFQVSLFDPLNAALAQATATVTVQDDDGLPWLTLGDTKVSEAEGIMAFPVTLDRSWPKTVTVRYSTDGGTATPSADYLVTSGELVLPAGTTSGTIPVQLLSDAIPEQEETVIMVLTAPVQARLAVTSAKGIILDTALPRVYLPALIK